MQPRSLVFFAYLMLFFLFQKTFVVIFIYYFLDLRLMEYVTVSAKVKRELYEKLKKVQYFNKQGYKESPRGRNQKEGGRRNKEKTW